MIRIKMAVSIILITIASFLTVLSGAQPAGFSDYYDYAPEMRCLCGSFFQPELVGGWSADVFAAKYKYLAVRNMDHVIWQWTADSGKKKAFYPTQLPGWKSPEADLVERSLAAAQIAGLQVWLGLNWTDEWWLYFADDRQWLEREFATGRLVARELWLRYGDKYGATIAGFYIALEVNNINFMQKEQQQRITDVYKNTVGFIHSNTGKPVMVAPYFTDYFGLNPELYAGMWSDILAQAPVDVIALQDGVGTGHVSVTRVGRWFAAMQKMLERNHPKTELWSDLETLQPDFKAADNDRIVRQIKAEQGFVSKITTFAVLHYQMPAEQK